MFGVNSICLDMYKKVNNYMFWLVNQPSLLALLENVNFVNWKLIQIHQVMSKVLVCIRSIVSRSLSQNIPSRLASWLVINNGWNNHLVHLLAYIFGIMWMTWCIVTKKSLCLQRFYFSFHIFQLLCLGRLNNKFILNHGPFWGQKIFFGSQIFTIYVQFNWLTIV